MQPVRAGRIRYSRRPVGRGGGPGDAHSQPRYRNRLVCSMHGCTPFTSQNSDQKPGCTVVHARSWRRWQRQRWSCRRGSLPPPPPCILVWGLNRPTGSEVCFYASCLARAIAIGPTQASATPIWTRWKEPWPRSFPPCRAHRWSNPRWLHSRRPLRYYPLFSGQIIIEAIF
jgi:hypothetical protein